MNAWPNKPSCGTFLCVTRFRPHIANVQYEENYIFYFGGDLK